MYYAILCEEAPGSLPKRVELRPRHLARLTALNEAGRLLLAGPFPAIDAEDPGAAGYSGSLIVAEFDSLAEAEDWAGTDPFLEGGVYARVSVRPFRRTLP